MIKISPLYNDILLNTIITSDIHIDKNRSFYFMANHLLKKILKSCEKSKTSIDVFATVGDNTSRGNKTNRRMFIKCFKGIKPAENIFLCIGNHDCWHDDGYSAGFAGYVEYVSAVCGFKLDKPYFSKVVKGYHFIFLGNDSEAGCEANISDDQFAWFKSEMKKAGESNKPVFVFCHQSLNQKHGLPRTWCKDEDPNADPLEGGIGLRSDEIENEMKRYKNVFYFSGHSHMGLCGEKMAAAEGYSTIQIDDNVTLINLPAVTCNNHHGDCNDKGWGFGIEVYKDRVVLRPMNFRTGNYNRDVAVKNGKPYYEVMI